MVKQRENVAIVDGEIIGMTLINGTPIRGESKAQLREVVESEATGFDEAQNEEVLPPQYHEPLKHYFGEVKKRVEAMPAKIDESEAASSEPAAEPETSD